MSILILYGSETGTAQDIAESLRRESLLRHVSARVFELDEYNLTELENEKTVMFVVSTTGQGEMPPNMRNAWRWLLRRSLPSDFLSKVQTAILGLGDSSYQKYNFAGKKLYRRLVQLGARMLAELCLADDQHEIGIDGAFIPWKLRVWEAIKNLNYYSGMTTEPDLTVKITPKFRFEGTAEEAVFSRARLEEYQPLKVERNVRVTAENHFQDTRLVTFSVSEEADDVICYKPGDVLMVRPYNPEETVKIAIDALGYSDKILDKLVRVVENDKFVKSPPYYLIGNATTLRICLQRYFDLQQVPKRSFFEILSYFSKDPAEKERLAELASPQGLDDLLDYANRSRRTTAEALRDFPVTAKNLEPDQLFEIFTLIRPRAFSIASAPICGKIELLVAKVEYASRMADKRRGLCSTFISRLKEGDEVFCKVRAGTFKFPSSDQPVICIGPGTGVAPFRSLFQERSHENCSSPSLLFFGCRSKSRDFYFEDEWSQMEGVEVVTAFSRDSEKKVYVQHKMAERAKDIKKLLDSGALVFIAGSSGDMPKAVNDVFQQLMGEEWTTKAEATGKIQYETWS